MNGSAPAPFGFPTTGRERTQILNGRRKSESLWTERELYLRFCCRYRSINVFGDSDPNGRRDYLWERDVAEVFLQPDRFGEKYYKEFEVSPNGQWLDLDITPQGLHHITSGMRSLVNLDKSNQQWVAELAIPMAALTSSFDPAQTWRVNFFRCEGIDPDRFYGCLAADRYSNAELSCARSVWVAAVRR